MTQNLQDVVKGEARQFAAVGSLQPGILPRQLASILCLQICLWMGSLLLVAKPGWANLAESPAQQPVPIRSWQPSSMAVPSPVRLASTEAVPVIAGNQLWINQQQFDVPWQQKDGRLGLADYGAVQSLGLELLNSEDPTQQPVRWFSDPTTAPITLSAWIEGGYRFLDITPLAQQRGWQLQPNAAALKLTVPPTEINSIRLGKQLWGDRLVIDLSNPTVGSLQEGLTEFTLTLHSEGLSEAHTHALNQQFEQQLPTAKFLNGLTVAVQENKILIRGSFDGSIRPQFLTLTDPDRIVIDLRADFLVPKTIAWAPGLLWRQAYLTVNGTAFPVYGLEVDLRSSSLSMRPLWSDPLTATGITPLLTMAQRWQAIAAINGGFFNRNNQYPLGAIRRDGAWISGPILSRGAIGWDDAGNVLMNRLFLDQILQTEQGQRFQVNTINSGYVEAGVGLYTPAWGRQYRSMIDGEILVTVRNDQVQSQQIAGAAGTTEMPIPDDGYLLAIRAATHIAEALPPGTSVTWQATPLPNEFAGYPHIVGAGPLLLKAGQIVLDAQAESFSSSFATQAATRSAIGLTDRNTLLLVTVHNSPEGRGITLTELTQLMQQLGSVDALNLDGGSSSSLVLGGRLLNRHPRTAARVHNGLGLFLR